MVTRAAKDLLKNTIRSTDYHNKMIEEEEMWRHWEIEKGLTMMVSDDYLRRMRMDEYPGPSHANGEIRSRDRHRRKRARSRSRSDDRRSKRPVDYHWTRELVEAEGHDPDRWGHSGYIELYPEEFELSVPASQMSETTPSCDLGRDDDDDENDDNDKIKEKLQRRSHKKKRKKTKHKRHRKKKRKSSHFDTDSETEELRQDIRNAQRKKRGLEPLRRKRKRRRRVSQSSSFSSSDSDVRIIGISAPRTIQMNGMARTPHTGMT